MGSRNASNAIGAWGGNHEGEGGNFVRVDGSGQWLATNDISTIIGGIFNLSSNETGLGVVTNN